MADKKKILKVMAKVATIALIVITLILALYIMANRLGLSDKLDFGAGAYYYADIPDFKKYVREDLFQTKVPYWIHVLLFLIWGWLMYKLWCWIDRKDK